jgi:excisionase family DNA binding protein
MTPLADKAFDPNLPLQTFEGARAALRIGHNTIRRLIADGSLKTVKFGRSVRITTESILALAKAGAEYVGRTS